MICKTIPTGLSGARLQCDFIASALSSSLPRERCCCCSIIQHGVTRDGARRGHPQQHQRIFHLRDFRKYTEALELWDIIRGIWFSFLYSKISKVFISNWLDPVKKKKKKKKKKRKKRNENPSRRSRGEEREQHEDTL